MPGWGFRVGGAPGLPDPDERLADPLVPGRRPRIPGAPLVALEQGRPFLAVSAAADGQVQDLLQVLLNLVEWRMGAREAAGQPRFAAAGAARLELDGRIPPEVGSGLEALGYLIEVPPSGSGSRGGPGVVRRDPVSGELEAAGGPAAAAGEAPPQAEAPPLEAGGA